MAPSLRARIRARLLGHSIDRRLLAGDSPDRDEALRLRTDQLLTQSYRHRIAEGLRRVTEFARDRRPQTQTSHAPVQRQDILEAEDDLLQLADDLETAEDAHPRGVILAS